MESQQQQSMAGRLAPMVLLTMLLIAPGPVAAATGYCSLRIRLTSSAQVEILNLAEIQLFTGNGLRLLPVQLRAKLTTVEDLGHSASKCIDGNLLSYCRSLSTDVRPTLTIDYPCPEGHTSLTKVIVSNIANDKYSSRINAFTLDFLDEAGLPDHPAYSFEGALPLYAIDVAATAYPEEEDAVAV